MDRRTLLTSMAAAAASGACSAKDAGPGSEKSGRPTLALESDGPGRWRIRSWAWRENAWHPRIARATRTDAGIDVSGPIDAADRAKVVAWLGA